MEPIVISFQLDLEEGLDLVTSVEPKRARIVRWCVGSLGVILVFCLLALPFILFNSDPPVLLFFLGILPLAVLMVVWSIYSNPRRRRSRRFLRNRLYISPQTVEISDSGIKMSCPGFFETIYQWAYFWRYKETEALVLLFHTELALIFPKRAFAADDLARFRELLEQKIPVPRFIK